MTATEGASEAYLSLDDHEDYGPELADQLSKHGESVANVANVLICITDVARVDEETF